MGVLRRKFLLGAVGVVSEAVALSSCASSGSRSAALRRIVVPTLPAATVTPPVEAKALIEPLATPLPKYFRTGSSSQPLVALTLDDLFTPADADSLGRLLDVAKAKDVRLSFFPTGGALQVHINAGSQDVWKRVIAEGHEIGNHTYTHRPLTRLSDAEVDSELSRTEETLARVLGPEAPYKMRMMRPPGGAGGLTAGGDARIMNILAKRGYSMAMWSIDSAGTQGHASYAQKIVAQATAGSIVLTHFQTFAEPNFPVVMDRLRNEKRLEPTNIAGLFA